MKMTRLSTEFVNVPIVASVELSGQTVEMAFAEGGPSAVQPDEWHEAQWAVVGGQSAARILVGPGDGGIALAPGIWTVWVKITDSPEIPALVAPTPLRVM